jgi:hypothetical protein
MFYPYQNIAMTKAKYGGGGLVNSTKQPGALCYPDPNVK